MTRQRKQDMETIAVLIGDDGNPIPMNSVTEEVMDTLPKVMTDAFKEICVKNISTIMQGKEEIPNMEMVAVAICMGAYKILSLEGHIKDMEEIIDFFSTVADGMKVSRITTEDHHFTANSEEELERKVKAAKDLLRGRIGGNA